VAVSVNGQSQVASVGSQSIYWYDLFIDVWQANLVEKTMHSVYDILTAQCRC